MTDHKTNHRQMVQPIIEFIGFDNISEIFGDDDYDDSLEIYSELQKREIRTLIPPPPNARVHIKRDDLCQRNDTVRYVKEKGYYAWANKNNFGRPNRAENTFYRIKTIFGRSFMSRIWKNQEGKAKLIVSLLNEMTRLGMPVTGKIF